MSENMDHHFNSAQLAYLTHLGAVMWDSQAYWEAEAPTHRVWELHARDCRVCQDMLEDLEELDDED